MKALTRVAVLIGLLAPFAASASCFFVYGAQNRLLYRSTVPPVDLSKPISEGVRARFSSGHLVMIPDESACPDLQNSGESQVFASMGQSGPAGRSAGGDTVPLLGGGLGAGESIVGSDARAPTRRDGPVPGPTRPPRSR